MTDRALIIFIKNPILGRVKTRLAKDVGDPRALEIYQILLAHTYEITKHLDCDRFLFYDSYIDQDDSWENDLYKKRMQSSGDLGNRMKTAFAEVLAHHSHVIVIGSDCLDISRDLIEQAFDQLGEMDIVLGPSIDGGYYLLGMNELFTELFDDIAWSTEHVLSQTITKILAHDKHYALLQELNDIDTIEDWEGSKD